MTIEQQTEAKNLFDLSLGNRRYYFSPRPLASLATLVVLPLLLLLGFWQLHRADVKREILAQYETNSAVVPVVAHSKFIEPYPKQYQHISIRGNFVPAQQILLDNRFNAHRAGFDVLTPFKLENSDTYILVNRGWVPRHRSRNLVPSIDTPKEKQIITLSGYLNYPGQHTLLLGQNIENSKAGVTIVQILQLDEIGELLQRPLYPFVLLLEEKQPYGFVREWTPVVMGPDMHTGYAVQWFALAISLLIIYIVVNLKSEKLND